VRILTAGEVYAWLFPYGDLTVMHRLVTWVRYRPERPALEWKVVNRRNPFSRHYRLTAHGERLRDRGLEDLSEAPPLPQGGCISYAGRRPWVRRVIGRQSWFERLAL
jgi:hypothetical protein